MAIAYDFDALWPLATFKRTVYSSDWNDKSDILATQQAADRQHKADTILFLYDVHVGTRPPKLPVRRKRLCQTWQTVPLFPGVESWFAESMPMLAPQY